MRFINTIAAGAAVATLGAAAVVPAVSTAATIHNTKTTKSYVVPIKIDALINNAHSVKATAVVTNPQANVSDWYSRATVNKVVQYGIGQGIEKPYKSQGYQCTPTIKPTKKATIAHFTCTLKGADVPTSVNLQFTANYNPPTGP